MVAVLGASSPSCDPETVGGGYDGDTKACELKPQFVHISKTHLRLRGEKRIVGKVNVHCQEPVREHVLTIVLQRKSAGQWRDMIPPETDNRVPPPDGKKLEDPVPSAVYPRCRNGLWRSVVHAETLYEGERFRAGPIYSPPNRIRDCRKP